MNDEGVCRKAPATPGLLISQGEGGGGTEEDLQKKLPAKYGW